MPSTERSALAGVCGAHTGGCCEIVLLRHSTAMWDVYHVELQGPRSPYPTSPSSLRGEHSVAPR